MKRLATLSFMVLIGLALITGCASNKISPTTPIQELKAPDWVQKGSGAFGGEQGKVFYGVASSYGIKNPSLARTAADNRAIAEISKTFQVYTASLMKDYMASTMAGDPNVTSEEQHVEQAIKTVTSMTISGVQIVDHWQNPATGEFFSLARLELDAFKDNLDKVKNLDKKVKEYIKENADKMHDELSKEEEKRK